ncbi:MAG: PhoH family protein, partial [Actinomycetota bacterium]
TTPEQMKMFLTRLGFNSKMIVTGDTTQTDLPSQQQSGLIQVGRILADIEGVAFMELTSRDVVRHRIVASIVEAYERFENMSERP